MAKNDKFDQHLKEISKTQTLDEVTPEEAKGYIHDLTLAERRQKAMAI